MLVSKENWANIQARRLTDGKLFWEYRPITSSQARLLDVADEEVVLYLPDTGRRIGLDRDTGKEAWQRSHVSF